MFDLTPEEQALLQFERAKRDLIEQMVLHGIVEEQARSQVTELITLALSATAAIAAG